MSKRTLEEYIMNLRWRAKFYPVRWRDEVGKAMLPVLQQLGDAYDF